VSITSQLNSPQIEDNSHNYSQNLVCVLLTKHCFKISTSYQAYPSYTATDFIHRTCFCW